MAIEHEKYVSTFTICVCANPDTNTLVSRDS